ncbi:MAG: D-alanyl-D-alanine carboxypeptidase family protein [Massiliimalia sp.]
MCYIAEKIDKKIWKNSIAGCLLVVMCLWLAVGWFVPARVSAASIGISAYACVLMEAQSGRILYGQRENETLPMASTTKIMTALLALESGDLDTPFQADEQSIMVEGSSMGLLPGDTVTMRDLCYGMLLSSGNDAANLAAVKISGSQEAFAQKMNDRAAAIGMEQTHFVTPSGLNHEDHYSTAYDMALLAREALENPDFLEICGQEKAKLCFGNPPYTRWLSNHNRLLETYEGCIGVKTGFTKAAGRCLVSAAERNGIRLICVTLNAPNDWQDHTKLLDWGFSALSPTELCPDLKETEVSVVGSRTEQVTVEAQPVTVPLTAEEQGKVTYEILLDPFYYAPVKQGDVLGSYRCIIDGFPVAEGDILAKEQATIHTEKKNLWESFIQRLRQLFFR